MVVPYHESFVLPTGLGLQWPSAAFECPRFQSAGLRPAYGLVETGAVTLHGNATRAERFQPQSRSQTGAPSIPLTLQLTSDLKSAQILSARNLHGSERFCCRRDHLDVEQGKAAFAQVLYQMNKRDL